MQQVVEQETQFNPELRASAVTFSKIFLAKKVAKAAVKIRERKKSREERKSRNRKKSRGRRKSRGRSNSFSYSRSPKKQSSPKKRKKKKPSVRWKFSDSKAVALKKLVHKGRSKSRSRRSRSNTPESRSKSRRPILPPIAPNPINKLIDSRCDAVNQEREVESVLPELRDLLPQIRSRHFMDDRRFDTIRIFTPEFCFPQLFTDGDVFRKTHQDFVLALALDVIAGSPFMRFLRKSNVQRNVYSLLFWQDAQSYLSTTTQDMHEHHQLRHLRARMLVHGYLQTESTLFTPSVRQSLREVLLRCDGDDLLRAAQDHVTKRLVSQWRIFLNQDKKRFAISSLSEKRRVMRTQVATQLSISSSLYMRKHAADVPQHMFARHEASKPNASLPSDTERRQCVAVQLAFDVLTEPQVGIHFKTIDSDEVTYDEDNFGSLALRPLEVFERPDIVAERARLAFNKEQRIMWQHLIERAEHKAYQTQLIHREEARIEVMSYFKMPSCISEAKVEAPPIKMQVPSFFKTMRRANVTHSRIKPRWVAVTSYVIPLQY